MQQQAKSINGKMNETHVYHKVKTAAYATCK